MAVSGVRTLIVSALAAVVAVRVSATQPLAGAYARIAADPAGAVNRAADGWSVAGTLGDASAQGLRDLPVAAFLWLTGVLGVPPAGGRTAWCALVLVLGAVGAIRLARATAPGQGARESWTPWIGAVLYACAPVLVTTVQHAPGDGLVVALLPWVLEPLVRRGDGWRAAAASAGWLGLAGAGTPAWALAALAAGSVAAVATSRRPGGARQAVRWAVLAAVSSAWWVLARLWEASYATAVTGIVPTDLSVDGLADSLGLPAASTAVTVLLLLAPLAVSAAGVGLRVGRDAPVVGSLVGLALAAALLGLVAGGWPAWLPVAAGVAGGTDTVPTPWAVLGGWLALAALVAWTPVVDELQARLPRTWAVLPSARGGQATAALVVLGFLSVAGPVFAVQADETEPAATDADQWAAVAAWSRTAPPGRVLVLPAVTDGRVAPAVAQALRGRPWVARDTLPLSGSAATTALDRVLSRLARGHDGDGTATALRRLGVSYVMLRADRSAAADRERPLALVRHALARQGASRVAAIGPGGAGADIGTPDVLDLGVRDAVGSVEVWALDGAADGTLSDGGPVVVAGDEGVVGDLADAGLRVGSTRVLGAGAAGPVDVVSDSARRQEVDLRVAEDPSGPVLDADDSRAVVPEDAAAEPTASRLLSGADQVLASSSAADLDSSLRRTGAVPAAAVDGNVFTSWQSRGGAVLGEWWEITFSDTTDVTAGFLRVVRSAFESHQVTRVRLEWDGGSSEVDVPEDGTVALTAVGETTRLRVVATGVSGAVSGSSGFAVTELTVPGLEVEEQLAIEGPPAEAWVVAARPASFATCVPSFPFGGPRDPGTSETVCNRALGVDGADTGTVARVLRSVVSGQVAGRAWVRAADSAQSSRLAQRLARPAVTATASSVASPDLVAGPQAASDGDPGTAWRAAPEDTAPTLTLEWDRPAVVSGVRVTTAARRLSTLPTHVVVTYDGSDRTESGEIGADGVVDLPPVRTSGVTLAFDAAAREVSVDSLTGGVRDLPVAVSEVEVVGAPAVGYDADTVEQLPCGSGPDVTVGATTFETAVRASARQVVEAAVVPATLCERPVLGGAEVRVTVEASFSWIPLGLVLARPDGALGEVDEPVSRVDDAGGAGIPAGTIGVRPRLRVVEVDGTTSSTLALAVPAGKGWVASASGRELASLTVDGWAQGWEVPQGVGPVTIRYASGELLRWAVALGASGWALVLALVCRPWARSRRSRVQGSKG